MLFVQTRSCLNADLIRGKVTTIADLRHALENTSYKPTDVPYTKAEHFDPEWAERVIRQLLVIFDAASVLC
jgi:hypothetical protein